MHFACLTDEDIDAVKTRKFSWPLNADFFEVAQNPVDWKYQVFVKARKEYKNFKRYGLGLIRHYLYRIVTQVYLESCIKWRQKLKKNISL